MYTEQQKQYNRKWYAAHREMRQQTNERNRIRLRQWFRNFKAGLQCTHCGEAHPACLDFHHRNPGTKKFEVSVMVQNCASLKRILNEIAKCDVLCANCHRIKHWGISSAGRARALQA